MLILSFVELASLLTVALCFLPLPCVACYCLVLPAIVLCSLLCCLVFELLPTIANCCPLLHTVVYCCLVLPTIAVCCLLLNTIMKDMAWNQLYKCTYSHLPNSKWLNCVLQAQKLPLQSSHIFIGSFIYTRTSTPLQ